MSVITSNSTIAHTNTDTDTNMAYGSSPEVERCKNGHGALMLCFPKGIVIKGKQTMYGIATHLNTKHDKGLILLPGMLSFEIMKTGS